MAVYASLWAARHIRSQHAFASMRCAYGIGVADVENGGGCRNGNERAQPSGSSWRLSRVAARLYCSNKSYHPAITAPITSPRDEYILACSLLFSLFHFFERTSVVVHCCNILQHPRAAHFIRAIVPSNCSSHFFYFSSFSFLFRFFILQFFLVLSFTPWRNRPHSSHGTRATRAPIYSSMYSTGNSWPFSHPRTKNKQARILPGKSTSMPDLHYLWYAGGIGYLDRTCVMRSFCPLDSQFFLR